MYIRTHEDALRAVAEILDLPERRAQIVQSTVQIMMCLDAEPRAFMTDCQALLLEGGLESLRRRRHETMDSQEVVPLIMLDGEGDRLFEHAATALDALRLSDVARQVFPDFRPERWLVARALLAREAEVRELLSTAITGRRDPDATRRTRAALEQIVAPPAWSDRGGTLRAAALDVLRGGALADPDAIHEEADLLFEILALSDDLAGRVLASLDHDLEDAARVLRGLYEGIDAVRALDRSTPGEKLEAA